MIALIRLLLLALFILLSGCIIVIVCLFRPFNPSNTFFAARMYGVVHRLLGLRIEISGQEHIPSDRSSVYIANHQSNYDVFIFTACVPNRTVSIGKKSILFLPVFGLIYWLSGNIFIERKKTERAIETLKATKQKITENRTSVWIFPEGTRNHGKGLLPFKTGAFHLARHAGVPIVPVCVSSYYRHFRLNRLHNGVVRIRFLPPRMEHLHAEENLHDFAQTTRNQMMQCIAELDRTTPVQPHTD